MEQAKNVLNRIIKQHSSDFLNDQKSFIKYKNEVKIGRFIQVLTHRLDDAMHFFCSKFLKTPKWLNSVDQFSPLFIWNLKNKWKSIQKRKRKTWKKIEFGY